MSDPHKPGESDVVPITEAKKRRSGHRSATPFTVPPLPDARTLTEEHRQHLASSAIDSAELAEAQVYSETERANIVRLLGRSQPLPGGSAIVFPFYEPDAEAPYGYRIRPDHPRRAPDNHVIKYDQASKAQGVSNLVYFPPRARARRAYRELVADLYAVEGEKKALVLDQLGYACIGLTGVWNWLDGDRERSNGDALHALILKHVTLTGRRCVIVFDQDARTNGHVMKAARRLAGAYYAAGAAEVLFVCPPDHQPAKGIDDYFAAFGAEATHALLGTAEPLSPADPTEIRDRLLTDYPACEGAPVPDGYVIPRGYMIAPESGLVTSVAGERTVEVSTAPILIIRRFVDRDVNEEFVDITFRRFGQWSSATVTRRALTDPRAMVTELAPVGAPMHSGHSKHLLQWFARLELVNEQRLAPVVVTNRTGWRGPTAFMLDTIIAPTQPDAGSVVPGVLLRRAVAPLRARGTLEAHLAALRGFWVASPSARMLICAALAAPLLRPLDEPGFGVHLFGDTNTGKSSMLRAAASVFGDPQTGAGWCGTWNISPSAAEARAAMFNDLPQCFDEVGVAGAEHVQKLIYTLIGGEGRSRATREGTMRGSNQWRTIVLSTGEITLADDAMAAGAQARVIDMRVPDFGALKGEHAEIAKLLRACRQNAGCLGRDWLESLCAVAPDYWDWLTSELVRLRTLHAGANNANARQLHYMALLQVVERLMHQNYDFPMQGLPSVSESYESSDTREVLPAHEHMADVLEDWVSSRPDAFPYGERHAPFTPIVVKSNLPARERWGIRLHSTNGELVEVLINRTEFARLCKLHGQSAQHVLRTWADLTWIGVDTCNGKRRLHVRRGVSGGGQATWIAWRGRPNTESEEK